MLRKRTVPSKSAALDGKSDRAKKILPDGQPDRRKGPRYPLVLRTVCTFHVGRTTRSQKLEIRGITLDLSSSGMLFRALRDANLLSRLRVGAKVEVRIKWPANLDERHPLEFRAQTTVIRIDGPDIGMVLQAWEMFKMPTIRNTQARDD